MHSEPKTAPLTVWPCSAGIRAIPLLGQMLGATVLTPKTPVLNKRSAEADIIAGWGARPSGRRAEQMASRLGRPCWRLEDGFLRSFGLGDHCPPLSVTVDPVGVYYDASRPSLLENMLNLDNRLLHGREEDVARARRLILELGLSKYNNAPSGAAQLPARAGRTVLVIDQTVGDSSIALAGASAASFTQMLAAARAENPGARIVVKTHPEAVNGRKQGHLTDTADDRDTLVLRELINPIDLLEQVDKVYTVSSQMGFEALLVGKPVHCFGLPWYAGWGQTEDQIFRPRRKARRSVDELFAAAYFDLSRYINPRTHKAGTIFDVIDFLGQQVQRAAAEPPRTWCVGFRRWKAVNVRPLIGLHRQRINFTDSVAAIPDGPGHEQDRVIVWGDGADHVSKLAHGRDLCRMEDGFVRSVGLGSDLVRPASLVFDPVGIYFDPSRPSGLEQILSQARFSADELTQAERVRRLLVENRITKYNIDNTAAPSWPEAGQRERILVPGQVADDASVRLGGGAVGGNIGLLSAVRAANPDAYIVYRPHPDVMSRNRRGALAMDDVLAFANLVETETGILGCIEACDSVHTISSLAGFDALLRHKSVHTHGQPFYAGWGLTTDLAPLPRRQRRLSLAQLIAGTLLRYPVYWDWTLKGYTDCEAAIHQLIAERDALVEQHGGRLPAPGYLQRQARKLKILGQAWTAA